MTAGTQTAEIITLEDARARFIRQRPETPAGEPPAFTFRRIRHEDSDYAPQREAPHQGVDLLRADRLYGDLEQTSSGTSFAKFFDCIVQCFRKLEEADEELRQVRPMEADLAYMDAKKFILRMNLFLGLNDSIALVIWALIKSIGQNHLAYEPSDRIYRLKNAAKQLMEYPNLSFDHAMRIVDGLEDMNESTDFQQFVGIQDVIFELAGDGVASDNAK